jgi:hypothetical protein
LSLLERVRDERLEEKVTKEEKKIKKLKNLYIDKG